MAKRKYVKKSDYWKKTSNRNKLPSKNATAIHEGAQHNYRRIRTSDIYGNYLKDARDIITDYDRATLANKARFFIENLPLVKSSIEEIATYAVGAAFFPIFQGDDKEWGKVATEWITKWMQSADVYGNDMQTILWMSSIALDRDGDIGVQLTAANENKYPLINVIPCHNIASKEDKVSSGLFAGYPIYDGVVYSDRNLPIGYNVIASTTGSKSTEFVLTKQNMLLLAEPRYPTQVRGYSTLASAINDLIDYRDIKDFEREAIKQASSIALIEKNEQGGADIADSLLGPTQSFDNQVTGNSQDIFWKYYDSGGGIVRYFGTNVPGAGIEQIENNRPGSNTAAFLKDHVLRHIYNSLNWPLELAYDMSGLNSANTRAILAKVERKLKHRQNTLVKMWRRVVTYAVAKAIKNGYLPENKEWFKWSCTLPARPTIDLGREVSNDVSLLKVCGTTLSNIVGKNGEQFEQTVRQRVAEVKMIQDLCQQEGVPIEQVYSVINSARIGEAQQVVDTQTQENQ